MEETDTLRQALEKMEHHGYAAVPLLSTEGKYLGTLTDGDVLWGLKKLNFPSLYQMEEIPVMQVNRSRDNKPVHVDVDMEGLLEKVSAQNFVPVIDDEKIFIGIITRRDVIHYLAKQCRSRGWDSCSDRTMCIPCQIPLASRIFCTILRCEKIVMNS